MTETADVTVPALVALTALPGAMFWRQNTGTFRTMDGKRVVKVSADGIADIMGCYCGKAVAVETKTESGSLLPSQKRFRKAWLRSGGVYIIALSAQSAVEQVTAL